MQLLFVRQHHSFWHLFAIGAVVSLLWLATTTPSAYFLHFDASAQDVAALELARGCWEYNTSKILPVVLLAPFFHIWPTQSWETFLLIIGAAISIACTYELTRLISGSRLAALLSSLLTVALPAFQYFSRTHLGYPMPFILLGWLALWHQRWEWSGLCFGLAITAHYNSWVPIGLSISAAAIVYLRPGAWQNWLKFGLAFIAPLLAMDALYFLHSGIIFEWNRGVFKEIFRLSTLGAAAPNPNWLWVVQTVINSNGGLLSAVMIISFIAPIALRRDKVGMTMSLVFLALAALYTFQAGMGRAFLVSRVLATSYPFWAISASVVLNRGLRYLTRLAYQRIAAGMGVLILAIAAVQSFSFIRQFTQTPYPAVEQWIKQAAAQGRSVRHLGNPWVPLFFTQLTGGELLTGDSRWVDRRQTGHSVLIFEGLSPENLDRTGYIVSVIEVSKEVDDLYVGLTQEATLPRHMEVWWPTQPSSAIGIVDHLPQYAIYYSGSDCLTPLPFGNGQLYFYQLAWQKFIGRFGIQ